jgi:hypothetical protein
MGYPLTSSLKFTYVKEQDKKCRYATGIWFGEIFLNLVFLPGSNKELFLPFEHGNHWS